MRRPNKWIVIDGFMDHKTKQWFQRLQNENTLYAWRELPLIAPSERVIVETDHPTEDLKSLPTVFLDEEPILETTLEETQKLRLEDVLKSFPEFMYKKMEVVRKIEALKRTMTSDSERVFEHLLATSLLSFLPLQNLAGLFFKGNTKLLEEFFQSVPFSNGWYTHKEAMDISPPHFYIIHTVSLLLHSHFIPLLVCSPSQEFFEFLARLQTELDAIGWHPITMSIDKKMTIAEIKEFVSTCAIML